MDLGGASSLEWLTTNMKSVAWQEIILSLNSTIYFCTPTSLTSIDCKTPSPLFFTYIQRFTSDRSGNLNETAPSGRSGRFSPSPIPQLFKLRESLPLDGRRAGAEVSVFGRFSSLICPTIFTGGVHGRVLSTSVFAFGMSLFW